MSYPYSWTPDRITPVLASQVTVWDKFGNPAALSTPVSVSSGTLSFALVNAGRYRISVRNGLELETGTFDVDITGVDISTPEFLTYSYTDTNTDLGSGATAPVSNFIRVQDIQNPASVASTTLAGTYTTKWQPNTVYTTGQIVQSPTGDLVSAITNFTSGSSYNAANWNLSASYATPVQAAGTSAALSIVFGG